MCFSNEVISAAASLDCHAMCRDLQSESNLEAMWSLLEAADAIHAASTNIQALHMPIQVKPKWLVVHAHCLKVKRGTRLKSNPELVCPSKPSLPRLRFHKGDIGRDHDQ